MKSSSLFQKISNLFPLIGAGAIHLGIAAYAISSANPVVITNKTIQISFVAPSSQEYKKENNSQKRATGDFAFLKQEKLQQKDVEEKSNEKSQKTVAEKKTSGRENPNSVATNAVETDPVFDVSYLNNPAPAYPLAARKRNIQGKVLLEVVVKVDGTAASITIVRSSGSALLDEAALATVQEWKFVPARSDGKFVQANVIVPIEFKII